MELSEMSSGRRWRGGKGGYFCWDWIGQERIAPLHRTSSFDRSCLMQGLLNLCAVLPQFPTSL